MSSLQHLNAINVMAVPKPTTPSKGLLYVEAQVNRKPTKTMIDTGATHNFVSVEEARRLRLRLSKENE